MGARNRYASYVLIVHAIVAGVFALVLLLFGGRSSEWFDWIPYDPTMTKMYGAALAALAVGSFLASRDPLRHRVIVQTEIVYTALGVAVTLYRALRFSDQTPDFAWAIFAVFAVFLVLFCLTYPRDGAGAASGATDTGSDEASPASGV